VAVSEIAPAIRQGIIGRNVEGRDDAATEAGAVDDVADQTGALVDDADASGGGGGGGGGDGGDGVSEVTTAMRAVVTTPGSATSPAATRSPGGGNVAPRGVGSNCSMSPSSAIQMSDLSKNFRFDGCNDRHVGQMALGAPPFPPIRWST